MTQPPSPQRPPSPHSPRSPHTQALPADGEPSGSTAASALAAPRPGRVRAFYAGNARAVVARGLQVFRHNNFILIATGVLEPILYLLAMGLGLGSLIGSVDYEGQTISYAAYIAPALLAASAMNGAVMDSTVNVFFRLKHGRLYEAMLTTSLGPLDVALGEILMAVFRGFLYACGFVAVMFALGLLASPWSLTALGVAMLMAFAFAAIGMGITSFFSGWYQLDWIFVILQPLFLFSATFYPIDVYPAAVQWVVQALPLWHGVELMRLSILGAATSSAWIHIVYFAGMIVIGLALTSTRLQKLFLR